MIWVILSVEVGGLLGVTQQLSSFETEFNTQPQRSVQGDFNPFASPQKNKHDAADGSFRDAGADWDRTQEPIQQDQNGLSHNAVNRASNGLQTNLSVVTYGQVRDRRLKKPHCGHDGCTVTAASLSSQPADNLYLSEQKPSSIRVVLLFCLSIHPSFTPSCVFLSFEQKKEKPVDAHHRFLTGQVDVLYFAPYSILVSIRQI